METARGKPNREPQWGGTFGLLEMVVRQNLYLCLVVGYHGAYDDIRS
jgi:hypothetical protein